MKNTQGLEIEVGDRVSWLANGATVRNFGTFENIPVDYHVVIYCSASWLTIVE